MKYNMYAFDEYVKHHIQNNKRFITELHIHHCWKPYKSTYMNADDKQKIVDNIARLDNISNNNDGFTHHLLLTPDGNIWCVEDMNIAPASIKGRNGNDKFGPISVSILGNFDYNKEELDGVQRKTLLYLMKFIMKLHNLSDDKIIFHRDHSPRTSPGSTIDKHQLLLESRNISVEYDELEYPRDILNHPFRKDIESVIAKNIMDVSDGLFHPNSLVTRGELAYILSNTIKKISDELSVCK